MDLDTETFELDSADCAVMAAPAKAHENAAADDPDRMHARLIVGMALLRGVALDHLWRHNYLRDRWMGTGNDPAAAVAKAREAVPGVKKRK